MGTSVKRRRFLACMIVLGVGVLARAADGAKVRVIQIVAKKFDYTPNLIAIKKGELVELEFTALDAVMGFSAPDFKLRTDIVPGKVSRLRLQPDRLGSFNFFCDIFCGSGHEDMTGTIVVS